MSQGKLFVPLIKSAEGDSKKAAKAALRGLFTTLLGIQSCAESIAEFKANGSPTGHKVIDDLRAVEALTASAPAELAKQINAITLTEWERVQVLNAVLRRSFEMVKGKLTGQLSKRLQLQQQKAA